jgi:hypothetical protein
MFQTSRPALFRAAGAIALAAATVLPLTVPSTAHAWWRGGWGWGWGPGVYIAPPVIVAPAPVYVAPPVAYAAPPVAYAPGAVWIGPGWVGGVWVRGHWGHR